MAPNPWQLYTSVKGWRKASGQLTRALNAALKGRKKRDEADAVAAFVKWYETAYALKHFGACDSEPRWEAEDRIKARLGVRL